MVGSLPEKSELTLSMSLHIDIVYLIKRGAHMPQVIVTTREGESRTLQVTPGASIMEAIRDGGVDELLALCGGGCACATCHVYVDDEFAPRLAAMTEDESELLESSSHRTERSRLSCQVRMTDELCGVRVTVAP
jgi:2Fe-2S ferredoxin